MIRPFHDFHSDVQEPSRRRPVVVDFWAQWCAPCRTLGPVLERLAQQAGDQWDLVKVDVDAHPDLAMQFQVQSIPAVKLFADGKVAAEFLGALPQSQIEAWLAANLPAPQHLDLAAARAALAGGDRVKAAALLRTAIEDEPQSGEARVLLAELLLHEDPDEAAHLARAVPEADAAHDRAGHIATLARVCQLARAGAAAAAPAGGADPDSWRRYLEGARAFAEGRFEAALQAWIQVIARDRALDDDGARRACVALFAWLGEEHPATRAYRRAFSSALF